MSTNPSSRNFTDLNKVCQQLVEVIKEENKEINQMLKELKRYKRKLKKYVRKPEDEKQLKNLNRKEAKKCHILNKKKDQSGIT